MLLETSARLCSVLIFLRDTPDNSYFCIGSPTTYVRVNVLSIPLVIVPLNTLVPTAV